MIDRGSPSIPMGDYDYHLPPELIAQEPLADRTASRLLRIDRATGEIAHGMFTDLPNVLVSGDLLVFNDTRVIPARLHGFRGTGGKVEFLLLRKRAEGDWLALAKPAGRLREGETIALRAREAEEASAARVTLAANLGDGQVVIAIDSETERHLDRFGEMPLPPYITRRLEDAERYQTVYARTEGSAAAPTAGLHFTDAMLATLRDRGVRSAFVTLHVGLDTFRPVMEEDAREHRIHSEWCAVDASAIAAITAAKARGSRLIAVGTTAARTLETYGQRIAQGLPGPFRTDTSIYITPGYVWTMVDGLITNFHLPKSTLLLMVSALAGRDAILAAYREAVDHRYRFFSFGDATIIL